MGVPKFFRYISERYPCLSQLVLESDIPEFDNLYLDMNGIIHNCSHPGDYDPHFRISEEKIFKDIFHYIEVLFRIIKPRNLFFMAVDGVAPRAKMNQQRGRRFRSAKETEDRDNEIIRRGGHLPEGHKFDSNCITPGTSFMARLQAQLKFFVSMKISTDKLWQNVKVILSGHECPGEGEHKIMDYIRYLRALPGYDPNTRHCLYGLDADLIMLGLCTHEPHFALLREEVKFGRKQSKKILSPEETKFFLLHLSLLREYLEMEFKDLKETLPFEFNLENIIDDWVLMGFLVGNDFIPHLPGLHISSGALPALFKVYADVLPTIDGYLNEGGSLNLARFDAYMKKLASLDIRQFREMYDGLKYLKSKTTGKGYTVSYISEKNIGFSRKLEPVFENDQVDSKIIEMELIGNGQTSTKNNQNSMKIIQSLVSNKDFNQAVQDMMDLDDDEGSDYFDEDDKEADRIAFFQEFCLHKQNYYEDKLEYKTMTQEVLRGQAEGYIKALQWNLNYYYNGLCSWSWYYPHHYAPYISDIQNFKDMKIEFDIGRPFLPFEQLLAVLPSFSKELLPKPFQELMVDEKSPIFDYYPVNFQTDLNGKKNDWEAVVLIPFIDEERLLVAMKSRYHHLTGEEKERNKHGPMHVFTYSSENLGHVEAPAYFSPIEKNFALDVPLFREDILVPPDKLQKNLLPGVLLDVYFPGFPTFKHLKYTSELRPEGVKVFQSPSQGLNMIVKVNPFESENLHEDLIEQYVNKTIYVNWPYLSEAKVVGIKSKAKETSVEAGACKTTIKQENDQSFPSECRTVTQDLLKSRGIYAGKVDFLLTIRSLEGQKIIFTQDNAGGLKIQFEKKWSNRLKEFPLQLTVKSLNINSRASQNVTVDDIFPVSSNCFLVNPRYYGCLGIVNDKVEGELVKLRVTVPPEPEIEDINIKETKLRYYANNEAAYKAGIPIQLLARITGTILVLDTDDPLLADKCSKVNIGLNLKFSRRNKQLPGFTKRLENNQWLYSDNAIKLLKEYAVTFPEVIKYLAENCNHDNIFKSDLFPLPGQNHMLSVISNWLDSKTELKAERRRCDTETLEPDEINELELKIEQFLKKNKRGRYVNLKMKPFYLYVPCFHLDKQPPAIAEFRLLDRVVNVRDNHIVPLGARGTIIGLEKSLEDSSLLQCDILFDQPFQAATQYHTKKRRVFQVVNKCLLNITYAKENFAREETMSAQLKRQLPLHSSKRSNAVPAKSSAIDVHRSIHDRSAAYDKLKSQPVRRLDNITGFPSKISQENIHTGIESTSSNNGEQSIDITVATKLLAKQVDQEENFPTINSFKDDSENTNTKITSNGVKVEEEERTLALKKMLKISDKKNVPSVTTSTKNNRNGNYVDKEWDTKGYVLELQELLEKAGKEIPRYDYQYVDGNFRATLFLPGVDIGINGDFAHTKKLAGERAAFVVLRFLQLVQSYGDPVLNIVINEITIKELNVQLLRLQQRMQEVRERESLFRLHQYSRPTPSQDYDSFLRVPQTNFQLSDSVDTNKLQQPLPTTTTLSMGQSIMSLSPSQFSSQTPYQSPPQFPNQMSQQRQVTFASNYFCQPPPMHSKYSVVPHQLYYQNVQNIIYNPSGRPNFAAAPTPNAFQINQQWGPAPFMFPPQLGHVGFPTPHVKPQIPIFNDRILYQGSSVTVDKPVPQNGTPINNCQSMFKSFNINNQNAQKLFANSRDSIFAPPPNDQCRLLPHSSNSSSNSFVPIFIANSGNNSITTALSTDSSNSLSNGQPISFSSEANSQNDTSKSLNELHQRPQSSLLRRASKTPKKSRLAANFSKMNI